MEHSMKSHLILAASLAAFAFAADAQVNRNVTGPQGKSLSSTTTVKPGSGLERETSTSGGRSWTKQKSHADGGVSSSITTGGGRTVMSREATPASGSVTGPRGNTVTRESTVDRDNGISSTTMSGPNGATATATTTRDRANGTVSTVITTNKP
jgi:hypothetical protein